MKIDISSKKLYMWTTIVFMMAAVVSFVISLFLKSFVALSFIMVICSWISYVEFKVEILNKKLNEPRPPKQD